MVRADRLADANAGAAVQFSEPEEERAFRLTAMWSRAAEMFREPEQFQSILDEIDEAVCFVDRSERVLYWNRAAEEITGYSGTGMIGHLFGSDMLRVSERRGCEQCELACPGRVTVKGRTLRHAGVYVRHHGGHWVAVRMRRAPLVDRRGRVVGEARMFRNRDEGLVCVERLARLGEPALVDRLTGLGNRRFAEGSLEESLGRLWREGQSFGVLLADVDGLAEVNRVHGQEAGDAALRVVAASLAGALRHFDVLARWGDSSFVALADKLGTAALDCVARQMSELAGWARVRHEAGDFGITVSVAGTGAMDGDTVERLMGRALEQLQRRKAIGKGFVGEF